MAFADESPATPRSAQYNVTGGGLDAVFTDGLGGEVCFLKGTQCFRFVGDGSQEDDEGQEEFMAQGLREVWEGIPSTVDTAFRWAQTGKVYFFKGVLCWCYNVARGKVEKGFPVSIESCWPGLPSDGVDAAFTWGANGKTYFFKGALFWCYDDECCGPGLGGPFQIQEVWKGIPDNIDAVFTWDRTGKTYFFKGARFWRFDDQRSRAEDGYPVRIREGWRGVPPMSDKPAEEDAADEFARCMEELRVEPVSPTKREAQYSAKPEWETVVVEWGAGPTPRPKARQSRPRP